jgi:hypothetical protein
MARERFGNCDCDARIVAAHNAGFGCFLQRFTTVSGMETSVSGGDDEPGISNPSLFQPERIKHTIFRLSIQSNAGRLEVKCKSATAGSHRQQASGLCSPERRSRTLSAKRRDALFTRSLLSWPRLWRVNPLARKVNIRFTLRSAD